MQVMIVGFVFAAVLYSGLRFLLTGNLMESAATGAILLACLVVLIYRTRASRFREFSKIFNSSPRYWLAFTGALGVVVMSSWKANRPFSIAALDGVIALVFFTAFLSLFNKKPA